ncbi:MAG: ATP-dependent helicase [Phycisphaerae bacterium]|nr:ATP-dependent helicase [Phycisphaerae bacterium]
MRGSYCSLVTRGGAWSRNWPPTGPMPARIASPVAAGEPYTPRMSDSWRTGLNEAQARAVGHDGGPMIVLAGPGTGKTRVIVARIRRLIEEGAKPETILALAFNVKAAAELRARLAEAVGAPVAARIEAVNFHSFGSRLIGRFGDWIGVRSERTIMDSAMSRRLLRRLIFDHRLYEHLAASGREAGIDVGRSFIEKCRNAGKTPDEAAAYAREWSKRVERNDDGLSGDALVAERQRCVEFGEGARLFALFDAECLQQGLMTFEDCLSLPLRIFSERPTAAAIVRDEFKHILVDEFQDQNRAQIELLRHLAPPGNRPDLCVVGDDDQAIYGFRGADTRAFTRFAEVWPEHERIALTVNYRSGRAIVAASNGVIARCGSRFEPEKRIEANPARERDDATVEGVILDDDAHAGAVVAAMIVLDRRANPERAFSSYAVLARTNGDVQFAASELERLGIPASIRETRSPADDEGVKDLLAWVSLLTDAGGAEEPAMARRLLARPPFSVPTADIHGWSLAYERERSRLGRGELMSFVSWIAQRHGTNSAVGRFVALLDELKHATTIERAERVIAEIIRRADLARSEDLDARARSVRIASLARVVGFARSRQRHLDEPGDLGAFARYYADLDPKEKGFDPPNDERLEEFTDAEEGDRDAVRLMTAHSAKGLEFDTVFLLKCRPRGFPAARTSGSERAAGLVVPEAFSGCAAESEEDEQRRLFYVACTRAERRLVLLAKKKGAASKTIDYFNELTQQTPGLKVEVHAASALLDQAGLRADDAMPLATEHHRESVILDEMARVRQHAYSALHDAADGDISASELSGARDRLAAAAGALHALECLRVKGSLPADVPGAYAARLAEVAARLDRPEAERDTPSGMRPPLRLSYSAINLYQRCPGCFYLAHVLGLKEEESKQLRLGSMVHKVLERFYREVRDADAQGAATPGEARLRAVCEATIHEMWPASEVFNRAVLDQALAQVTRAHATLFEPASNILEIERDVIFRYPDPDQPGMFHEFRAKIDRVDQSADGGFVVVDYKSGSAKDELRQPEPSDLQLCVYAMALGALLGDGELDLTRTIEGWAEYWILSETVRGRIALGDLDLAKARAGIDEAIRGMLAGRFKPSKKCDRDCRLLGMIAAEP